MSLPYLPGQSYPHNLTIIHLVPSSAPLTRALLCLCTLLWDLIPEQDWEDKAAAFLPYFVVDTHRLSDRYQQPLGEHISV